MIDISNLIDRAKRAPTLGQKYIPAIADAISTNKNARGRFTRYQKDLVAFARNELMVDFLTEDQERFLRAIIDHERVIVMSATGTGKTFVLAIAALGLYKAYESIEVYTAAAPPEANLRKLLWGEINRFVRSLAFLFNEDKLTHLNLERAPKQFVTGVPIPAGSSSNPEEIEAKFSGKHQAVIIFVFDEGDAIPDPVFVGADGCMSGGLAKMIICFNPRVKSGEVWRMIKDERAHVITMSALDHPNVRTGMNVVPGAVTRAKTIERINQWCQWEGGSISPDDETNCFRLPDFLEGETAPLPKGEGTYPVLRPGWYRVLEQQFWYKVLGTYPPGVSSQLIRDDWIDAAYSRWELYVAEHGERPPRGVQPSMGLDVADMGPDHNVATFLYGSWLDRPEKWNGVDPDRTAERASLLYQERNARRAAVDGIGVGAGVAPRMTRNGCSGAESIKVSNLSKGSTLEGEFKLLRDEAYWGLRLWFENGQPMIPFDKRLDEALRAVTYEVIGKNVVVMPKKKMVDKLKYSPDELESLMLHFTPQQVWLGGI